MTFLATASKERLQQFCAAAGQNSPADFRPVIQLGMVQHLHHRMDCARFRIVRAVYQAFHSGMHQRACAHGAWFNCSKELAVSQAMVAEVGTGLAKGNNFGVGGGIGVGEVAIPASTNDLAGMNHDRADGDLAGFQGALRRAQGFLHPEFVRGWCWSWVVGHWSLVVGHWSWVIVTGVKARPL
jgi:hypothetical protein